MLIGHMFPPSIRFLKKKAVTGPAYFSLHLRDVFLRLRFAKRTEKFPLLQRAYMTSTLTTGARVNRLPANLAYFHVKL